MSAHPIIEPYMSGRDAARSDENVNAGESAMASGLTVTAKESPYGILFNVAATIAIMVVAWYLNGVNNEQEKLRQSDAQMRQEAAIRAERLPLEYVRKDEYRADINEVKSLLREITRKVDGKADRNEASVPRGNVGPGVYRDGRDINR